MDIKNKTEVRNEFLDSLENSLSKMEGSYNFDIASGVGAVGQNLYEILDYWSKQAFIDTATDDDIIDSHAVLFGVSRRGATKAVGEVSITGVPGTLVTDNTIVLNRQGLKYRTTRQVYLDGEGKGKAGIEALESGLSGNCAIGEITSFEIINTNLYSVTNEAEVKGGFEKEPNSILIARAKEKVMEPAHSGNVNDYKQWAREVDGVGDVHVIPLWAGNGTVKVLVSDYNYEQAQSDLIHRVKERIEREDGRPVGAKVTVESFKQFEISIGGTVLLEKGVQLQDVQKVVEAEIRVALRQGSVSYKKNKSTVISINKLERIVLNTAGVVDCTLTLNSGTVNVEVGEEYAPHLREVRLRES